MCEGRSRWVHRCSPKCFLWSSGTRFHPWVGILGSYFILEPLRVLVWAHWKQEAPEETGTCPPGRHLSPQRHLRSAFSAVAPCSLFGWTALILSFSVFVTNWALTSSSPRPLKNSYAEEGSDSELEEELLLSESVIFTFFRGAAQID